MKNITRISIAFSLVLLLAINMDGRLIAQTTKSPKQKRVHLNIRQIDFMNRVDSDLRRERSMNDPGQAILFQAYGGANTSPSIIDKRIDAGLRDPSDLLMVIQELKKEIRYFYASLSPDRKDEVGATALNDNLFSSLTRDECLDLLKMDETKVWALGEKYATYLKQVDEENQKKDYKLKKQEDNLKKKLENLPKY